MEIENDEVRKIEMFDKEFLIDLLTDLEALKSFIYEGHDVPAYRNVQKISDKIKDKIRKN